MNLRNIAKKKLIEQQEVKLSQSSVNNFRSVTKVSSESLLSSRHFSLALSTPVSQQQTSTVFH
jgi:hypothetical protein